MSADNMHVLSSSCPWKVMFTQTFCHGIHKSLAKLYFVLDAAKHHVHLILCQRYAARQADLLYLLVELLTLVCNERVNTPPILLQHVRPRQCGMWNLPNMTLSVNTMCAGRPQCVLQALAHFRSSAPSNANQNWRYSIRCSSQCKTGSQFSPSGNNSAPQCPRSTR